MDTKLYPLIRYSYLSRTRLFYHWWWNTTNFLTLSVNPVNNNCTFTGKLTKLSVETEYPVPNEVILVLCYAVAVLPGNPPYAREDSTITDANGNYSIIMNGLPDNDYIAIAIFDGDPLLGLYPNRASGPSFTIPPVTPPPDGVVGTSLPMLVTSVAGVVLSMVAGKVR